MSVNILQAQKEFKKLSYALENPNLKPEDRQKIVVELLDLRGSLVSEFDSVLLMISLIHTRTDHELNLIFLRESYHYSQKFLIRCYD